MKFHPYSKVFPSPKGQLLRDLTEDIRANGQKEPIWTYAGMILDGRARFLACEKLGVDPVMREFTDGDALTFAFNANMRRRRLSLSHGQRAFAAAGFQNILRKRSEVHRLLRDEWISNARASFHPGEKKPCAVCAKYESIANAHHVIPLWMQFDNGASLANHEIVWLCPNHHIGVHRLISRQWPNVDGFPQEEIGQMAVIAVASQAKAVANAAA